MPVRITSVLLALAIGAAAPVRAQDADALAAVLARAEKSVQAGDAAAFVSLLTPGANRGRVLDFAQTEFMPGAVRAVVKERDREPLRGTLAGNGYTLIVDVLAEFGSRARAATW